MSYWLIIIFVIRSYETFGCFPSKFLKCCFRRCVRSSYRVAFSLAFVVLFLLLNSFTVCYAILEILSLTESLILLIWFCMYSVCSFRYILANSFCAFLSFRALIWFETCSYFRALILFRLLLLYLEVVFTSASIFLTANVSHGTLGLALCLVGIHNKSENLTKQIFRTKATNVYIHA